MSTGFEYEIKVCEENRDAINNDIGVATRGATYGLISADVIFNMIETLENDIASSYASREQYIGSVFDIDYNANDVLAKRQIPPNSTQFTYIKERWMVSC